MSHKTKIVLRIIASALILLSLIGIVGQNLSFGTISADESYADRFASTLLFSAIVASVAAITATTQTPKIMTYALGSLSIILVAINNPFAYHGADLGYIENPWSNPALLSILIGATTLLLVALIHAKRTK